jgi:uncharacterized protein
MMFARLSQPARAAVRMAAVAGLAASLTVIAACSSPSSRFYTLNAGDAAPATARTAASPSLLIEVPPVDVPAQVAKYQMVVQTGPMQVKVLEEERWASLPGDEIRRALSSNLTAQLGAIDVYGTPYPEGVPLYRVSVNVQRFESWPGSHALIDAVWSVRAVRTQAVLTCRSVVNEPVAGGYDALADGHRRAVQQISTEIAASVQALAAASPVRTAAPVKGASAATAAMQPVRVPCPSPVAPGA